MKWKGRDFVHDAPMGPKAPRSTVPSPEEEALIVTFRKHTLLLRDFPILSGFPNHANSASPLLIVRWGEDYGTSLQPGFA